MSSSVSWWVLLAAGLFEVVWAVGLKYTQGFTRPLPSLVTAVAFIASIGLLSLAMRAIPLGTAYAVWVGIGAVGAAVLGIVLFGEPASVPRLFFLVLLLVAIVGLKLTSAST